MTSYSEGVPGKDACLGTPSLLVLDSQWREFSLPLLILPISLLFILFYFFLPTITVDVWHQLWMLLINVHACAHAALFFVRMFLS